MLRFLLIILSAIVGQDAFCQASGRVSGVVLDSVSNTNLELATVSLFGKDSALVNYQLSDKNGEFNFTKLPLHKDLRLDVSYVGYTTYRQTFRLDSSTLHLRLKIALPVNIEDSNTVIIKSIVPIRMNGDTLEINPAAFKMEKTAVAEELLNQVPGIVIWADGSITVNGRPVPKILVDGKPFLNQTDPTVATQNLPKNAIDKIQLYQEIDRTKEQRENTEQDSTYTMNIKLKKNKKSGYFGKMGAGYGTDSRYETDGSFQWYNKRNSFGIGGGINNVNKNIGSIQQMLSNNTFRKTNPNLFSVSTFSRNGINKGFAVGAVYTHDFVDSENGINVNSLSSNYSNSGNNNFVTTNTVQERTTRDFAQFIESQSNFNSETRGQSVGLSYNKSHLRSGSFGLNASGSQNESSSFGTINTVVKDSSKAFLSTNELNSVNDNRSQSANVNFNLNRYSQDNPLLRFNFSGGLNINNNLSESGTLSRFDSYTNNSSDTSYNRRYNNDQESIGMNLSLSYQGLRRLLFRRFALFGVELTLEQTLFLNNNTRNSVVADYDSATDKFVSNNRLSNDNKLQTLRYTPTVALRKSFNKWNAKFSRNISLSLRLGQAITKEINQSSFQVRNVDRSFAFFTPGGNVNYNYFKQQKFAYNLSIGYNRSFTYPSVDQLYTITDSINVYSVRFGNPFLKNTRNDNASINFSFNRRQPKAKYEVGMSLGGNINFRTNPVADSVINEASGKRRLYYINADDGRNINANYSANIARKIRKNSIQLQYNGTLGTNRSSNFIDEIESTNRNKNVTHNVNLQYSLKTLLILATLNYSKNITFNSTVSTTDNSNLARNFILWHAFGTYRFLKNKQAEVKLSAFDLLKKYQNVTVNTNIDGTSTIITNGLRQYFLVSLSYYPRKFGRGNSDDD
ncbi:MAG: hypothetical protein EOO06_14725 [Chitinophagaceae bacterium]|nr:MAG: hypothetical protein EOO06_14725 [Chitinophagaceae bacterium]